MEKNKLDGLLLGIWAMVFAFIMPLITYILGGIGLSKANSQIKSDKSTPKTAKFLNSAAMIITTMLLFIFAFLGI